MSAVEGFLLGGDQRRELHSCRERLFLSSLAAEISLLLRLMALVVWSVRTPANSKRDVKRRTRR